MKGKVCVVTGGARGIGRGIVETFAREGALRVWALDMNEAELAALERDIPCVKGEVVNVADGAAVEAFVAKAKAEYGRIDVLVNNAGITRDALIQKMTESDWDAVINVNLKGPFLCARAVVPHMIRGGGGVILNASSVVGLYGNFGQTSYVASKAGVIGMTRVWARELGRHGIRVNAVAPGFIGTEMVRQMPGKVLDTMVSKTPLGRLGRPEEIGNAYVWLASEAASYVTGAVISVDGGVVTGT